LGCSSSTAPTYLKENIADAIQNISKTEYEIDVKAKLVGRTLWIYIPVEDLLIKADDPDKIKEIFEIGANKGLFEESAIKFGYLIKNIPEKEKLQEYEYNEPVLKKVNHVWKILRRTLFSMDKTREAEPKFFYIIAADIKNGIILKELFYLEDLKKVSYAFISWTEFQHRNIQDTIMAPEIIGDEEGELINYRDITFQEFLIEQIKHRIKIKFQKPEVEANADIDKETIKVVRYTLKTYKFQDFSTVEMYNLVTDNKIILNRKAVLAGD